MRKKNIDVFNAKQKILKWLQRDGFSTEEIPDRNAFFNILAWLEKNRSVNIIISKEKSHNILIGTRLLLDLGTQNDLANLTKEKMDEFLWDLKLSYIQFPVGFILEPATKNFEAIRISKILPLSDLDECKFFDFVGTVLRALVMGMWKINKILGKPAEQTSPAPSIIYNIENMYGSQIQSGTTNSYQTQVNYQDIAKLTEIIGKLKIIHKKSSLNLSQNEKLKSEIDILEQESDSKIPVWTQIKNHLLSSISIISGIREARDLIPEIIQFIQSLK